MSWGFFNENQQGVDNDSCQQTMVLKSRTHVHHHFTGRTFYTQKKQEAEIPKGNRTPPVPKSEHPLSACFSCGGRQTRIPLLTCLHWDWLVHPHGGKRGRMEQTCAPLHLRGVW